MKLITGMDGDRLSQARHTAQTLLDEIELGNSKIMSSLLKAKRLARLMRDDDATTWLDLESRGYPGNFNFSSLGNCEKYAIAGGRVKDDGKYYTASLPDLEAKVESSYLVLQNLRFPASISPSYASGDAHSNGAWIAIAVQKITDGYTSSTNAARKTHSESTGIYNGLKSALHSYVTDCHHALSLSDEAEKLFDQARRNIDNFVRAVAPKAASQFAAAFERFEYGDPESYSHALTSCRRLLQTMADGVFPAQDTPYIDSAGRSRKVGTEDYKNRLIAYLETRLAKSGQAARDELEFHVRRIDSLYEKASKGVHAEVTADEVRLVLIGTYLLLGEIARLASSTQ